MMDATDVFSGITAFLLLAVVGCLLLLVTGNHRSGLRGQCILFLCAIRHPFPAVGLDLRYRAPYGGGGRWG